MNNRLAIAVISLAVSLVGVADELPCVRGDDDACVAKYIQAPALLYAKGTGGEIEFMAFFSRASSDKNIWRCEQAAKALKSAGVRVMNMPDYQCTQPTLPRRLPVTE